MQPGSTWLVVGWIGLHLFAMATACGTRIAAGSHIEKIAQACFFGAMAAIGVATWICQQLDLGWTWSAITLMAMVLTAVIDFRRVGEPAAASISPY
jgi:hypothetical protein